MRYLGIDYGEKRIGLAISDELGIIAGKLKTIEGSSLDNVFIELKKLIQEYLVDGIVVGVPKKFDGGESIQTVKVKNFIGSLREKINLPVYEWSEILTSRESERVLISASVSRKKRKNVIDQLSAVLILQNYLDSRKSL